MPNILEQDVRTTAHYLMSEANGRLSREQIIIASGAGKLVAGTVLGQVTASKKYVPIDPEATDGSQTAKAVLFEGCDATTADVRRTITARSSEVVAGALVWPSAADDADKNTALASLAALDIIAR